MKWIFFWEDEGEKGENSFIIEASDHVEAFDKAYNDYGPQVESMYCKELTLAPPQR